MFSNPTNKEGTQRWEVKQKGETLNQIDNFPPHLQLVFRIKYRRKGGFLMCPSLKPLQFIQNTKLNLIISNVKRIKYST